MTATQKTQEGTDYVDKEEFVPTWEGSWRRNMLRTIVDEKF